MTERFIIPDFVRLAVDRKLNIPEVFLILFQRIGICFCNRLGIIPESAAAECTQDKSVCVIHCGNMQDMLCPLQVKAVLFFRADDCQPCYNEA